MGAPDQPRDLSGKALTGKGLAEQIERRMKAASLLGGAQLCEAMMDLGRLVYVESTPIITALRSAGTESGETQGAAEMREAAKIACLDLADAYREASEAHMAARVETKAREAMDWAIGAMECAHAIAKLRPRTTDGSEA